MNYIFLTLLSLFVPSSYAQTQKPATIKAMSFNVRYNSEHDGINRWENRKDWVAELINFHKVDLLGTQEVTYTQLQDLKERLPLYDAVGVGRDGGKKGEFSTIFLLKERFTVLENNTFWLSSTPSDTASVGWDAALPRIVTYVKVLDKHVQKELYFFNTHFDHKGSIAREQSAKLLLQKIETIAGDHPVILTGDFNSLPESTPYMTLLTKLKDSRLDAVNHYSLGYTFNGWNYLADKEYGIIDYIFYNGKSLSPITYQVVDAQRGKTFVSDHFPVLTTFRWTGVSVKKNKKIHFE